MILVDPSSALNSMAWIRARCWYASSWILQWS